jgi:hypothetical protein
VLRRRALFLTLAVVLPIGSDAFGETKPSPQWSSAAATDGAKCLAALKASGAKFTAQTAQTKPNKQGCGMPQGVTLTKGPTGIVYSPALEVDCSLAMELPKIEAILQEEALASLGSEIKRIDTLGSYACRASKGPLTTAYGGKGVLSEHAFGLAFDLKTVTTKKGAVVTVSKDWGKSTKAGAFLAPLRRRLLKETAVTHVITPDYNAAHHDHLHIDRGLPWGWWWN